jgi:hypothetical protein
MAQSFDIGAPLSSLLIFHVSLVYEVKTKTQVTSHDSIPTVFVSSWYHPRRLAIQMDTAFCSLMKSEVLECF